MDETCVAYCFDDLELELEGDLWPTSVISDDTSVAAPRIGYKSPLLMYKDQLRNDTSTQNIITLSCIPGDDESTSSRRSRSESSNSASALLDELLSEEHAVAVSSSQSLSNKALGFVKDPVPDSRREKRQKEQKEKRRQQNRIAQQRFREGKEAKMKEACDRIILLETRLKFQIERNCMLEREWLKMKAEIDRLGSNHSGY